MKQWGRRIAVVAGSAAAVTGLTVTAAAAAGPPMPDFRGKPLESVYRQVDYRTRVDLVDASGFDRNVLWPLNWKVCTQSPAPGKKLNGEAVTLRVVKDEEKCPK
ncbi:hypothetical protein ACFQVC_03565 [Streptomyces monticola]|uniref:PASTA domain-containing protein n=1 Tax=Streptomyces monticola TaxID=2666263 RepID=A0ABW2JCM8_9ACTN